jgi:hypothetical protein
LDLELTLVELPITSSACLETYPVPLETFQFTVVLDVALKYELPPEDPKEDEGESILKSNTPPVSNLPLNLF